MALVDALMGATDIVRVLALSGSLRRVSSNTALVSAAARVAPVGVEVSIYAQLADVPPFDPDLDVDTAPTGVVTFRAAIEACDAILICSPEYARGVSGVLKNALDWIVRSGELIDKPIEPWRGDANTIAQDTHLTARIAQDAPGPIQTSSVR